MVKIGSVFAGKYGILEKLGSGGTADVYRAQDLRANKRYVIRVLKASISEDPDFVHAFEELGAKVSEIDSKHVAHIYEIGNVDDQYYAVMEYVDGITLKEYIGRRGALSSRETLAIASQMALGLKAAHQHHLCHRDLKTENVLLSRDGKAKITDFGFLPAGEDGEHRLRAMGSAHYMAPEQTVGKPGDERSDIYSLGICMYEMITGHVPFDKATPSATALAHRNERMVAPSVENEDCSLALEQIIFRCTQKSAKNRYRNCTELIEDLKIAYADPHYDFTKVPVRQMDSNTHVFSPEEMHSMRTKKAVEQTAKDARKLPLSAEPIPSDSHSAEKQNKEHKKAVSLPDTVGDKILKIAAILLGVVILGLGFYIVASFTGLFRNEIVNPSEEDSLAVIDEKDYNPLTDTHIPSVIGMDLASAMQEFEKAELTVKVSTTVEYSDTIPLGSVCRQNYDGGLIVRKKSTIWIVLSAGSDKFEIQASYKNGSVKIFRNDISKFTDIIDVEYIRVTSDTVPANTIISIEPSSGYVTKGGKITVTYSTGPAYVSVPDLIGLNEEEAREALENVGLALGEITTDYDDTIDSDLVCKQEYEPDVRRENGSTVDIVLSLGPKEMTVPFLEEGTPEEEVREALEKAKIRYVILHTYQSDSSLNGTLKKLSPSGGEKVKAGETVKVYLYSDASEVTLPEDILLDVLPNILPKLESLSSTFTYAFQNYIVADESQYLVMTEISPEMGSKVPVDACLTLKVNRPMPDLSAMVGLAKEEALETLQNDYWTHIEITEERGTGEEYITNHGKIKACAVITSEETGEAIISLTVFSFDEGLE